MTSGNGMCGRVMFDRPKSGRIIGGRMLERAHTLGKYRGKQADHVRHLKALYYRQVEKLSIREIPEAIEYSYSEICRIQALYQYKVLS